MMARTDKSLCCLPPETKTPRDAGRFCYRFKLKRTDDA